LESTGDIDGIIPHVVQLEESENDDYLRREKQSNKRYWTLVVDTYVSLLDPDRVVR
jgi:hypothetical protein